MLDFQKRNNMQVCNLEACLKWFLWKNKQGSILCNYENKNVSDYFLKLFLSASSEDYPSTWKRFAEKYGVDWHNYLFNHDPRSTSIYDRIKC